MALFFCSGATALVYEVVWSKFLSQMFGSTIYAQTVVIAVFMGGLALGNHFFGRAADRLRQPVGVYGTLEIMVGIYALLFPLLDGAVDHFFVLIGRPLIGHSAALLFVKGVLSAALLLAPTILMGATLPLLAAWLQRTSPEAGRHSARFYAINTFGAVAGAALAGFWLVQNFGLIRTLQIAAAVNLSIGTIAVVLNRLNASAQTENTPAIASRPTGIRSQSLRGAGAIVAFTGAVSMGLEVLSTRALALIFGSSVQTFAVVLIAFILGIGAGSTWISSRRRGGSNNWIEGALLCLAATWIVALVFNIEHWVDIYRLAHLGMPRNSTGYIYHQLFATGMSVVILGFPAALIGAVLPLMIQTESAGDAPLGARVGVLLKWNTLGAVVGTLLTGFVLMPQAGLRNAFAVMAVLLAIGAFVVAWRRNSMSGIAAAVCVCLFSTSLFVFGGEQWRTVISSGVFRIRETEFDAELMPTLKEHMKILFYDDAPDATVSVEQMDGIIAPTSLTLRINGKPDAGTRLDMSTQLLLCHLPMLAKPDAKDVFVLGIGSGVSAGGVLAYPVERLDVAENCEPVVKAARLFGDWNHHVLDNPRTHVWNEDARTVLKLRPQQYDVIITEPSNPWSVGIGSVFSRQFYELAAARLKPGGIIAQWFQVYEMQDDVVELVLRTFGSVFPYMEIWDAGGNDIVILGSKQPWHTGADVFRRGFANERVRTDLWMIDIQSPEALLGKQLASQRTASAIAGDGPIQSDLFPILEYAAPRAFYIGNGSRLLNAYDERTRRQLLAPRDKRETLASLPPVTTQILFSTFLTVNAELQDAIFGAGAGSRVSCVFPTATPAPPAKDDSPLTLAAVAFEAGDLDRAEQFTTLALKQNAGDAQAAYLARVIERESGLTARHAAPSN